MRTLLLGLGAIAALMTAPAVAQTFGPGSAGATVHSSFDGKGSSSHRNDGRSRRGAQTIAVMEWDGGEWAAYNNRSWESDSYNDWWHDRPDRAFPRWVQNNRDCKRVWWSGGGWRC
jgi:hypothetical protein